MKSETKFSLSLMRRWSASQRLAFGGLDNCGEGGSTAVTFETWCFSVDFESLVRHPHRAWLCVTRVLCTSSVITGVTALQGDRRFAVDQQIQKAAQCLGK